MCSCSNIFLYFFIILIISVFLLVFVTFLLAQLVAGAREVVNTMLGDPSLLRPDLSLARM